MEATQLGLFTTDPHAHVYAMTQGPYVVQGEITTSDGNRWCWTCGEWVTVHADGRTDTYSERSAFRGELIRAIKDGRISRNDAIKSYRAEFQTSFETALWEIDWAIAYYNENGWV